MHRSAPFLIAAASVAVASVPVAFADTPTRVGVDQVQNVSFRLTGASLTVTLRPDNDKANRLAAKVSGRRVSVACSGKSPETGKTRVAYRDLTWKKKATVLTTRLNADVSDGVHWCVLERPDPPRKDYAASSKMRVPNPDAAPASTP